MKKTILLCFLLVASTGAAADGVNVFQSGLQAFRENGADALLSAWYASRDDVDLARTRASLTALAGSLGPVLETETFAPHNLGAHVQRLYGVVYFEKRPLWIRADYYSISGREGFIGLQFSLKPEEILPAAKFSDPR